jgi:hypothetical protein
MRLVAREALTSNERFKRLRQRFQAGHVPLIARLVADGYASGVFDRKLHPALAMLSVAGMGVVPQLIRRALDGIMPFPGAPGGEELARSLVGVLFSGAGAKSEK